jgi:hypothetical protein
MELDPNENEWVAWFLSLNKETQEEYMDVLPQEERKYLMECLRMFELDLIDSKVSNSLCLDAQEVLKKFMLNKGNDNA